MSADKEYEFVVTVNEGVDWQEIHTELTRSTGSETVPDRTVDVRKLRSTNTRNTHYNLTIAEANRLQNDPRIMAVEKKRYPRKSLEQSADFNNTNYPYQNESQWGLLRHTDTINTFRNVDNIKDQNYEYVLDGTGVDVVIQDTGIKADHPEWQDANGVSRLKNIDWFSESGVSGSMPSNHYTDIDGHGTHVAGTVAGKRFGWAKNADIYVQQLELGQQSGSALSDEDATDTLIAWHNSKSNGRPTVVNMSYGYFQNLYGTSVGTFFHDGITHYPVESINWRGSSYSANGLVISTIHDQYGGPRTWTEDGYYPLGETTYYYQGYFFGYRATSVDVDLETAINAGIIPCIAAGNHSMKIDVPSGVDYNNNFYAPNYGTVYYHRGSSPYSQNAFMVGSLAPGRGTETKSNFSDSGPGVDIYTAGDRIVSAWPGSHISNWMSEVAQYESGSPYYKTKLGGTSMASPNMAGMVACLLQAHPDWSPKQVKDFFLYHATSSIYTSGSNSDYSNRYTLHGGEQRVAYFPMHGKTTHNWKSK